MKLAGALSQRAASSPMRLLPTAIRASGLSTRPNCPRRQDPLVAVIGAT
jgi:hypothetical protein